MLDGVATRWDPRDMLHHAVIIVDGATVAVDPVGYDDEESAEAAGSAALRSDEWKAWKMVKRRDQ